MMFTSPKEDTIMAIKKDFQALVDFLETNQNKKVASILEQIREMCSQQNTVTFKKDAEGNVTEVFCYYHKRWELVSEHEYGKKASNKATGLNTMCKAGYNQWTKQQSAAKKAKEQLLARVAAGEELDIATELELIEAQRQLIVEWV